MRQESVENREGSLGFSGVTTPVFTKGSKPPWEKENITRLPRDCDIRAHLKKENDDDVSRVSNGFSALEHGVAIHPGVATESAGLVSSQAKPVMNVEGMGVEGTSLDIGIIGIGGWDSDIVDVEVGARHFCVEQQEVSTEAHPGQRGPSDWEVSTLVLAVLF
ncbi:hypothetical protein TNCV_490481 [Trichonephila clavipes]|nr:hypothetical protein TNCV_490481 [Trichonephila clavipes]